MTHSFHTLHLLLMTTFLITFFSATNSYGNPSQKIDSSKAHLSSDQLAQDNLNAFVLDCLNQKQTIDEIITGAKALGYTEEHISITLDEILEQATPAQKSNFKKYLAVGICTLGLVAVVIGCVKLHNYWQNKALNQDDQTQPLNIRMTVNNELHYVNDRNRLNDDERRQLEAAIVEEIQRGIAQNRPALDIINDIKRANPLEGFDVITSGRGSLVGAYVQPLGHARPPIRVLPGQAIRAGSDVEFGDIRIPNR